MTARFYRALCFAIKAHDGQYDKGGEPYVLHPIYLAEQMDTEDEKIVALFHDVVEDTENTLEDIAALGFAELVEPIDCLTKRKGNEVYAEYMGRVQSNYISLKVKIKDMKHNSDRSRLKSIDSDIERMLSKYNKWLPVLESKLLEWHNA